MEGHIADHLEQLATLVLPKQVISRPRAPQVTNQDTENMEQGSHLTETYKPRGEIPYKRLGILARKTTKNFGQNEVKVLRQLRHHHIEYMLFAEKTNAIREEIKPWFFDRANAIQYLHNQSVRHGDLKPGKILVEKSRVYITGFSISQDFKNDDRSDSTGPASGTRIYCAPEVVRCERRDTAADIFPLGAVFVEILTVLMGDKIENLQKFIIVEYDMACLHSIETTKIWLSKLLNISSPSTYKPDSSVTRAFPGISGLIRLMLDEHPSNRPTARSVLMKTLNSSLETAGVTDCCLEERSVLLSHGIASPQLSADSSEEISSHSSNEESPPTPEPPVSLSSSSNSGRPSSIKGSSTSIPETTKQDISKGKRFRKLLRKIVPKRKKVNPNLRMQP
ncbi:kinase-like protein [Patellaria atrata CBS 101060]|uniref:Kinase-like protein n=1 Tax=Patellaria atrata CBS 101060 TaxID=1346257 RepID=A0A9P4VK69_9PEZI|nr:kinase-like protein [Patellaria atrata CBS 101060]